MRKTLFLLLLFTLTCSAFTRWEPGKHYKSKEIVYQEGNYYISLRKTKSSDTPDVNKRWRRVPDLRNPEYFREGYSFPTGYITYYRGITYIASDETDYEIPGDSSRNWIAVPRTISTLPPMPDPEADTTIAGIDSNGDGIRDDIEIAIVQAFPDDPERRTALMTVAKGMTMKMITYSSLKDPTMEDMKLGDALTSIGFTETIELQINNSNISKRLYDIITNTPERYLVSRKSDKLFHGESIPADGFKPYRSEAKKIYDAILMREQQRGTLPALKTLPPMPDVEIDTTIAGIDSNSDGIRDDIEITIVQAFPDDPERRAALMTVAKGMAMKMITYSSLKDPTLEDMKPHVTTLLFGIRKKIELKIDRSSISRELYEIVTNTPERFLVSRKSDKLFHGESIPNEGFKPYRSKAQKIYDTILLREQQRGKLPALKTLPPMPDVETDTTIAGIDSNGDGIRDDIEILIVTASPDNPIVRAKLLTQAKGICMDMETYDSLENPTLEDLKLANTVFTFGLRVSQECVSDAYLEYNTLRNQIFNTPERYLTYQKSSRLFHATLIPSKGYPEHRDQAKKIYDQILKRELERNKW